MARKGKKSQPVQTRKKDSNVLIIKIGLPTQRDLVTRKQGPHDRRSEDLKKGHARRPKHRGCQEW